MIYLLIGNIQLTLITYFWPTVEICDHHVHTCRLSQPWLLRHATFAQVRDVTQCLSLQNGHEFYLAASVASISGVNKEWRYFDRLKMGWVDQWGWKTPLPPPSQGRDCLLLPASLIHVCCSTIYQTTRSLRPLKQTKQQKRLAIPPACNKVTISVTWIQKDLFFGAIIIDCVFVRMQVWTNLNTTYLLKYRFP